MHIPFVDLVTQYRSIKSEIDLALAEVLEKTAFIGGTYVNRFEKEFAQVYGVKHFVSCGNGTDSLYIIMKMLGIGPGDEVITAANSWISSSETITQTGAAPVFVDVDPIYYSLDETLMEEKISKKTKAIIAVHLQGQMCNMDVIVSLCKKHKLFLIEDCAQSHFSEYHGTRAGLLGIAGSFSFYPGKNLGAYGDAGGIITNDDRLAQQFMMYARHGSLKKHEHVMEGINSRMDGLQAAVLSVKLRHIIEWTDRRIKNASLYDIHLKGIEGLGLPTVRPGTKHTFHLYVIRAKKRDALAEWLKSRQIETGIHYPTALPNLQAYQYLSLKPSAFPVASRLQDEILSLPMYPELSEEMIQYTAEAIREFYAR